MFNRIKCPQRLVFVSNLLIGKSQRLINTPRTFSALVNDSSEVRSCRFVQNKKVIISNDQSRLFISRNKYKSAKSGRKKAVEEADSSDEDEEPKENQDELFDKNVKTFNVKSTRIDLVLKHLFGLSRKKIEDSFYENKIRINGKVVLKKSQNVREGDEIDLIFGIDSSSSNNLKIGRVIILKLDYNSDSERYVLKAESFKSLSVQNYSGGAAWKEPDVQD